MVFYTNSDGRAFTEYTSFCQIENKVKSINKIGNNYDYKLFLQRNASKLMQENTVMAIKQNDQPKCDCKKCVALTYRTFN